MFLLNILALIKEKLELFGEKEQRELKKLIELEDNIKVSNKHIKEKILQDYLKNNADAKDLIDNFILTLPFNEVQKILKEEQAEGRKEKTLAEKNELFVSFLKEL